MKTGEIFNPFKVFTGIFIPNVMVKSNLILSSSKLIYGRLCQYAGEKGFAFPKIETLAEEVALSKSQVIRCLEELETNKFIKIIKPIGNDKYNHKTNNYVFLWHSIFETPKCHIDTSQSRVDDTSPSRVDDTSINMYLRESVLRESKKKDPPLFKSSINDKTLKKIFKEFWELYPGQKKLEINASLVLEKFKEVIVTGKDIANIIKGVKQYRYEKNNSKEYEKNILKWLSDKDFNDFAKKYDEEEYFDANAKLITLNGQTAKMLPNKQKATAI